jgi:type II secretory pathway pseudopilin PulG
MKKNTSTLKVLFIDSDKDCLNRRTNSPGLTLIELIAAVGIIGILIAILIVGIGKSRESALVTKSGQQMREIGHAVFLWSNENQGRLPTPGGAQIQDTWYVATYPYIYGKPAPSPFFDSWERAENLRGTVYYCPLKDTSGEGPPIRSYAWNNFLKDMQIDERPPMQAARVTNPSKTMMLATSLRSSVMNGNSPSVWNFSTRAGGKILILFADGRLERLGLEEIPVSPNDRFWRAE